MCIRIGYRKRNTSTKKSLDEVANMLRADIKGKAGKEGSGTVVVSPPSIRAIQRLLQRNKYALCQFISPQKAHEGKFCDCLTR